MTEGDWRILRAAVLSPLFFGRVICVRSWGILSDPRPVSMSVIIGILMRMGIVTKNAIMLERVRAIVETGTKRARQCAAAA
jgi:multidrug efflux pump subunit AcrB